eukprot:GEMP01008238.1.p1 GENE.GEMP01008238.1~~GEMP01008238.1.p1  ORF type:complete len:1029 (+),score=205.21 GEMP01008238.1:59-3088(+)
MGDGGHPSPELKQIAELRTLLSKWEDASDSAIKAANLGGLSFWSYMFVLTTFIIVAMVYKQSRDEIVRFRKLLNDTHVQEAAMQRNMFHQFIAYRLDTWLSSQASARLILLLLLTFFLIVCGAVLLFVLQWTASDTFSSFGSILWRSWTFIADAGAHGDVEEPLERIAALFVTIGGMFIFALVISMITESVQFHFDNLRKGKARVLETEHYLILGWSSRCPALVRELCISADSEGGVCIVVLSEMDKQEAELELVGIDLINSTLVCRCGIPFSLKDLNHVSVRTAKTIVLLSDESKSAQDADNSIVRLVMCLQALNFQGDITAELRDSETEELLKLVGMPKLQTVVNHDFLGRMLVQCSRQRGLVQVLESLLGFDGCEFYSAKWPAITGQVMRDVHFFFDDAIVVGVKTADGIVSVNIDDSYVIKDGDEIVVVADDDDTYWPRKAAFKHNNPIVGKSSKDGLHSRLLIINSRPKIADLVDEAFRSCPGHCTLLAESLEIEPSDDVEVIELAVDRRSLAMVSPSSYDHILVLSGATDGQNDANILTQLLVLKDLISDHMTSQQSFGSDPNSDYFSAPLHPPPRAASLEQYVQPGRYGARPVDMTPSSPYNVNRLQFGNKLMIPTYTGIGNGNSAGFNGGSPLDKETVVEEPPKRPTFARSRTTHFGGSILGQSVQEIRADRALADKALSDAASAEALRGMGSPGMRHDTLTETRKRPAFARQGSRVGAFGCIREHEYDEESGDSCGLSPFGESGPHVCAEVGNPLTRNMLTEPRKRPAYLRQASRATIGGSILGQSIQEIHADLERAGVSVIDPVDGTGPHLCAEVDDGLTREILTAMNFQGSCVLTHSLAAAVLAMVMVNHDVANILDAIFNPIHGNRFVLRDSIEYVSGPTHFWDVVAICRGRGEILFGSLDEDWKVELNPPNKSELRDWGSCRFIILRKVVSSIVSSSPRSRTAASRHLSPESEQSLQWRPAPVAPMQSEYEWLDSLMGEWMCICIYVCMYVCLRAV